ncbi:hypothetical protein F511_18068 [Dorcoceras hygrometricum]|uniref:Uncharacterized protein n=1 Tax=Dorcoceras hygrometricum TaxID=472368 RepID=A0A2Z7CBJ9_9LAMI|nr:hypothetical protein F511_18068 [Dorcoceras hygrometricum]
MNIHLSKPSPAWITSRYNNLSTDFQSLAWLLNDIVSRLIVHKSNDVASFSQLEPISTYSPRLVRVYYKNDDVASTSSSTNRYITNQQVYINNQQIAAIRSEQLDFQSKIAADLLSLSTQIGDIVDHIRGGDAKKGEIGSSSRRPPPIRVERRPLPTPANQVESSSGDGRVPSVEEAAEMIREADRQADRRER